MRVVRKDDFAAPEEAGVQRQRARPEQDERDRNSGEAQRARPVEDGIVGSDGIHETAIPRRLRPATAPAPGVRKPISSEAPLTMADNPRAHIAAVAVRAP